MPGAAKTPPDHPPSPPPVAPKPPPPPPQELKPRRGSFIFPKILASSIVATLIGAGAAVISHGMGQPLWLGLLAFAGSLLLGIFAAHTAYRKERYLLQDSRLVCHRGGLFSDQITEFEIRNITHVKLKLPWLRYRLFRIGDVLVETAGSAEPMVMRAIHNPETIYAGMRGRMKFNGYDLTGRDLLHEEKPALIAVLGECLGLLFGVAFVCLILLLRIFDSMDEPLSDQVLRGGLVGILFVMILFLTLRFLDLRRRTYRVFNDVVVYEEGFLTRENAFIPYENIADSNTRRSFIDQIFGLYDVLISCQGSSSEIKFRRLKHGIRLSSAIDRLVSSAGKKSKSATTSSRGASPTKRPTRTEPATVSAGSIRPAEYRIHAPRLLVPQLLLLPLFPIWILGMIRSLILISSTRYFVRSGSLRHSYKFLRVDDREFSYDKITGVVIKRNLWDQWFGTMTLKFWSIGSGKPLEFAHVRCAQISLPSLMRQVGIPPVSGEAYVVPARFELLTWLRAQIGVAIGIVAFACAVFAAALFAGEPLIYLLFAAPVVIAIGGLFHGRLYYTRQHLRFHEHHLEAEHGIIAKTSYHVRYKNVKRVSATRYPGGKEGSLKIFVAGEEQAHGQAAQAKGRNRVMRPCAFTSGMLVDPVKSATLLDDILSGRVAPSPQASPAIPSETLVQSSRSAGNSLATLILISVILFPLAALLPITIPITIIRVKRWRYRVEDHRIVTHHGVLFRNQTSVLLDRVDSLQQSQGLLNKMFRNGKVNIMTAGSSDPDLVLTDAPAYLRLYEEIRKCCDSAPSP